MKLKFKERLRALEQRLGLTPGLPQPIIFISFEAEGLLEPVSGSVDDVSEERIERLPSETLEQFKNRLVSLPHRETKFAREIFLFPPDPPDKPA